MRPSHDDVRRAFDKWVPRLRRSAPAAARDAAMEAFNKWLPPPAARPRLRTWRARLLDVTAVAVLVVAAWTVLKPATLAVSEQTRSRLRFPQADVVAPTVTITAPTSSSTFDAGATATLTTLAGTASDASGIASCTWVNDQGGSGSTSGTTSWSVASITLQSGTNVITVTCRDGAGVSGLDTLSVTHTPGGGGGSGSGCNGACVLDQSFPSSTFNVDSSVEKSGGGACTTFSQMSHNLSSGVWVAENGPDGGANCAAITSAANFSGGAGGRGLQHYRRVGDNQMNGALGLQGFNTGSQFWFSYVSKETSGHDYSAANPAYTKDWYISSPHLIFGHQGGAYGFNTLGSDNHAGSSAFGASFWSWSTRYTGGTANGTWACFDWYINFSTGRALGHINGEKILDETGVDYGGRTTVTEMFNNNQNLVSVAGAVFFDDIKIDNNLTGGVTDRIGCPGFSPPAPAPSPLIALLHNGRVLWPDVFYATLNQPARGAR